MNTFTKARNTKKHILLVEDSRLLQEQYRDMLVEAGYYVHIAASGKDALVALMGRIPDLVLLDLGLPDIEGVRLIRPIKKRYPDLPLLVCSANQCTNDKVRALQLGADDYITKPCVREELVARIDVRLRLRATTHFSDSRSYDERVQDRLIQSASPQYHIPSAYAA